MKTNELRAEFVRQGLTFKDVTEKTGMSVPSLSQKMNHKTEFRASEIVAISKLLNLTPERIYTIFFED